MSFQREDDRIGTYPKKFDIPSLRNRQIHWTAWFLMVALSASMILNFALVAMVMSLFPLKRVEPLLVQFTNRSDVLAEVIPLEELTGARQVLLEAGIREYLTRRFAFTPDGRFLEEVWGDRGYIRYASSENVYRDFREGLNRSIDSFRRLISEGAARNVNIVRVNPNPVANNFFDAQFEIVTRDRFGTIIDRSSLIAIIGVEFRPGRVPYEDRLKNPTGFTVTSISIRDLED